MGDIILVTGGAGYIGSHVCVELLAAGHGVVVLDSLVNSKPEALRRVAEIAGRAPVFHRLDLLDESAVRKVFRSTPIAAVVHLAGLKAVGESCQIPLTYYHNNLTGTLHLLRAMGGSGCRRLVFSSSATVYGDPATVPITEDFPLSATNPYGRTKLMIEEMLRDLCRAEPEWRCLLLRYFNPVGAHPSGRIGEDPLGTPNNLLPFLAQVAVGRRDRLRIFGADYPTPDGTGVRDYLHVVDLARGHLAALRHLDRMAGCAAYNLGRGRGASVREVVAAFTAASGRPIPCEVVARRPGDVAVSYADASRARRDLGWQAEFDLPAMCADAWRWQSANPAGYGDG
jgi:UDP-glucose 4-epimerase